MTILTHGKGHISSPAVAKKNNGILLYRPPVGHDPQEDGDYGKETDGDEINRNDPDPLATEDNTSQRIDRIILGIDNGHPYQPVRHAQNRIESTAGHKEEEIKERNRRSILLLAREP